MSALFRNLWRDEAGLILSAELVIILTITVLGMVVGLVNLQNSLLGEFGDLSLAFHSLNQSYSTPTFRGCWKAWGPTSSKAGSSFVDIIHDEFLVVDQSGVGYGGLELNSGYGYYLPSIAPGAPGYGVGGMGFAPSLVLEPIGGLSIAQIQALTVVQIQSLTAAQVSALTGGQLQALLTWQVQAFTPLQIQALTVTQIRWLTTAQIEAFTASQREVFSQTQTDALTMPRLTAPSASATDEQILMPRQNPVTNPSFPPSPSATPNLPSLDGKSPTLEHGAIPPHSAIPQSNVPCDK